MLLVVAEVDQQSRFAAGCFQIVEDLGAMLISQFL